MVCACYSPYKLTTTTGAAVPFRFRRTKNRAGDPYRNRFGWVPNAARNRSVRVRNRSVRTGPNWNRFGFGLVFCLGGLPTAPVTPTTLRNQSNGLAHTRRCYLPSAPRLSLSGHSVGHITAGLRQWSPSFGILNRTKPVYIYCLLGSRINIRIPLVNRILITRILINRIGLQSATPGGCMVRPLPLHWHINTIANCAFPAFAGGLD